MKSSILGWIPEEEFFDIRRLRRRQKRTLLNRRNPVAGILLTSASVAGSVGTWGDSGVMPSTWEGRKIDEGLVSGRRRGRSY